jgi:hypothetical protein
VSATGYLIPGLKSTYPPKHLKKWVYSP